MKCKANVSVIWDFPIITEIVILLYLLHKFPLHFSYLSFVFRQECNKLREELRLQHEEDKKAAMTQLLQLKEREKNAARDGWQKKVEDLLDQVTNYGVFENWKAITI